MSRQGGGVGEPVEHLADPGPGLVGLLPVAPVARGEGVAQAVRDDPRLDGQLEVEVLALVDELLRIHPHLLHQFLQKPAEQEGQQRTGQVQPLVAVLIPVIQVVRLDLSQ